MPWFEIFVAISELIAVYLIWKLWKTDDYLIFKICYSLLALIPFLGPFFVLWSTNIPSRQHASFQDRERYRADVLDRWRHVVEEKSPQKKFRLWRDMVGENDEETK
jgi:hypothetical protein